MIRHIFVAAAILGATLSAQSQSQLTEVKVPRPPMVGPDVKMPVVPAVKQVAPGVFEAAPIGAVPSMREEPPKPLSTAATHAISNLFADSSQVLFDQPTTDGPLWFQGANYKVRLDAAGWSFVAQPAAGVPRALPVHFQTTSVTTAGKTLPVTEVVPVRNGNRAEYRHAGFVEIVELNGKRAEQSFRFDALTDRGEIRIAIATAGERVGEDLGTGIAFHSAFGDVVYGEAVAIDAVGDRVPAETELVGGVIQIRVPAEFVARAQLPLVVDPQVTSTVVYNGVAADVSNPDIAWDDNTQSWAVTFERLFSADDIDCYVQRLDANLLPLGGITVVDVSFDVWSQPKIANLHLYGKYLVVAQVSTDAPAPYWIAGRIMDNAGTLTTGQFDIERAGVAGHLGGDKLRPDVGGDPYLVGPTYFTVVWERAFSATDHDVHMKQVTEAGVLRNAAPTLLDNAGTFESKPSISKTDGPGSSSLQRFMVSYQRTFTPTDEDIRGVLLTWDGQIVQVAAVDNFSVDFSGSNHTLPQAATPTDGAGNGTRYSMMVYQQTNTGAFDVAGAVVATDGTVLTTANLTALENNVTRLAWPQFNPTVDSDGVRFGVLYQELFNGAGTDNDTRIDLFAFDPVSNSLLLQENAVTLGFSGSPEFNPQIASVYSGSGVRSTRYGTTHERSFANPFSIEAYTYDGYGAGGLTTRATTCGTLAITAVGRPAVGQAVDFSLANANPITGFLFGLPQSVPLGACPSCVLGVNGTAVVVNPLHVAIPPQVTFVGLTVSVQGFTFGGGPCLGTISLSDTIDLTVQ